MSGRVSPNLFLLNMNAGRQLEHAGALVPEATPATPPVFDREASAKRVLQDLSERGGHAERTDLVEAAGLNDSQAATTLDYLEDAGLVEPSGNEVRLSGFGRDALSFFTLS